MSELKPIKKHAPVHVKWLDSCASDGQWSEVETVNGLDVAQCETAALFVRETEHAIVLASTFGRGVECGDQYSNVWAIPKAAITQLAWFNDDPNDEPMLNVWNQRITEDDSE